MIRTRTAPRLIAAAAAGFFALLAGLSPMPAWADLFTVSDVPVDAEATTAAAAREVALAAGQREAYGKLLRRLTLRQDYDKHPELDDADIAGLVQSFEVDNEKTSATRYLANLRVQFSKEAIRELLRAFGIPFSETASRPVLVIPVYETAGTKLLWDEPNPWMVAWTQHSNAESLVPMFPPLGDLQDITVITATQAIDGDADRIKALADRYGVSDALVAAATLSRDFSNNTNRLTVNLFRYGDNPGRVDVLTFTGAEADGVESLLMRAVSEVTGRLEEDWKRETTLRFGSESSLSATVPLNDLSDWLTIRDRLSQIAEVRKVDIASLSMGDAQLVLHFLGDQEQLSLALAQRDLELVDIGGFWTLRMIGQ